MNKGSLLVDSLKLLFFVKFQTLCAAESILGGQVSKVSKLCTMVDKEEEEVRKIVAPPGAVRGMKELNKDMFTINVIVPYVTVTMIGDVREKMKLLKPYYLKLDNLKVVQPTDGVDEHKRIVLFSPDLVKSFQSFPKSVQDVLHPEEGLSFKNLTVSYENWSIDDILKAILPEELRFSGFTMVGHIVHLNLRDNLLEYKHVIGQLLLDKLRNVRTVVNKVQGIDNTYRNFNMELLCGENDMVAKVRQSGITYEFDFSTVYWNTRLSTEHERIIAKLKRGDYLYDVFCGVGPFVLPAAKKGVLCLANDLNPEAIRWLHVNILQNRIYKPNVVTFNRDAGDFIREDIKRHLLNIKQYRDTTYTAHVTMNLPSTAILFLNHFHSLFTPEEYELIPQSIHVHLYCFLKGEYSVLEGKELAKRMVESHLDAKLTEELLLEVVNVRHVSPNKDMYRVSFRLPREVLVREGNKRPRLTDYDPNVDRVESNYDYT